jgi:transposase
LVVAQVPGLRRAKAKQTVKRTVEALMAAIDGYRSRAATAGRIVERVGAGCFGFWLVRLLARRGVETYVMKTGSANNDCPLSPMHEGALSRGGDAAAFS